MSYFTPLPFAPGAYTPVTGNNYLTFVRYRATPYTMAWGAVTDVAGDASTAAVVAFPLTLPNAIVSLQLSVATLGTQPSGYTLVPEAFAVTTAGFSVSVSGGAGGSLVTVYYLVVGY